MVRPHCTGWFMYSSVLIALLQLPLCREEYWPRAGGSFSLTRSKRLVFIGNAARKLTVRSSYAFDIVQEELFVFRLCGRFLQYLCVEAWRFAHVHVAAVLDRYLTLRCRTGGHLCVVCDFETLGDAWPVPLVDAAHRTQNRHQDGQRRREGQWDVHNSAIERILTVGNLWFD